MKRGIYLFIREWRGIAKHPLESLTLPVSRIDAALWQKYGRGAAGALLLSLLAPLMLLSESRLKETIGTLFNGCLFVIDVRESHIAGRVEVLAYMSGQTPDYLNLTFRAQNGLINNLKFTSGVLVKPATDFSSLVLHPMAGQSCPGKLCETPQLILKPTEQMTIRLPYPSSNFDYVFTAHLSATQSSRAAPDRLSVFSIADATKVETCRVEAPNVFNLLVRLDKLQRFFAYCAILFIGSILVFVFKRWGDKS